MYDVILGEQTPKVDKIENPVAWLEENKALVRSFLSYAKTRTNAIGLAANQVSKDGERLMERMFCSRAEGTSQGDWKVYINPRVVKTYGDLQDFTEGCLTWPTQKVLAKRYLRVDVEYYDINGMFILDELSGWEAQVWQHEQDHLDGIEEVLVSKKSFTIHSNKIGRNEPCPCGKEVDGKPVKYKKCCWRTK